MNFILHAVVFILKIIDKISNFLELFGIKIMKINRKTLLQGFPPEIHEEVNEPDIKFLFDKTMEAKGLISRIWEHYDYRPQRSWGKAMEKDEEMSFLARFQAYGLFKQQLEMRLLLKKTLLEKPEILEIPIDNPLFIVGIPRSGTTFLSWFLSYDKQFRSPMMWEQLENCPPGPVADFRKDPRYERCVQANEFRKAVVSDQVYAAHPSEADKPEECALMFFRSFYNVFLHFPLQCMDEYSNILNHIGETEHMRHIYRYYKKNLQVLAYKQNMENRRYMLKAPNHLLHLHALTEVFPGAQLIFTHRKLTQAVPSFFSLTAKFREQYGGVADHNWRRRVMATLRCMLTYGARFIDEQEASQKRSPIYSIAYSNLVADPLGEMKTLYSYFGITLTRETEEAWRKYVDNDPVKTKYPKHKYTIEEFNITKEDLAEEFKEYIEIMSKRVDLKELL